MLANVDGMVGGVELDRNFRGVELDRNDRGVELDRKDRGMELDRNFLGLDLDRNDRDVESRGLVYDLDNADNDIQLDCRDCNGLNSHQSWDNGLLSMGYDSPVCTANLKHLLTETGDFQQASAIVLITQSSLSLISTRTWLIFVQFNELVYCC